MRSYISTHGAAALMMSAAHGLSRATFSPSDDSGASMDETLDFSLADLMDMDVSDIEEMRFETIPMGIYVWEVTKAELIETTNRDDEKRFVAEITQKIIEVKNVAKGGIDKESLIGKSHKEKMFINPAESKEKIAEAIGRIRAHVADMGCENTGALGPMISNTESHTYTSKLIHQKDRNDSSIIYARLKLEPAKKKAA